MLLETNGVLAAAGGPIRTQLAGLSLLERLAYVFADVADIDQVDDLAVVLHETSCPHADNESHSTETCPDYRDRRFHRWAWELRQTVAERVG